MDYKKKYLKYKLKYLTAKKLFNKKTFKGGEDTKKAKFLDLTDKTVGIDVNKEDKKCTFDNDIFECMFRAHPDYEDQKCIYNDDFKGEADESQCKARAKNDITGDCIFSPNVGCVLAEEYVKGVWNELNHDYIIKLHRVQKLLMENPEKLLNKITELENLIQQYERLDNPVYENSIKQLNKLISFIAVTVCKELTNENCEDNTGEGHAKSFSTKHWLSKKKFQDYRNKRQEKIKKKKEDFEWYYSEISQMIKEDFEIESVKNLFNNIFKNTKEINEETKREAIEIILNLPEAEYEEFENEITKLIKKYYDIVEEGIKIVKSLDGVPLSKEKLNNMDNDARIKAIAGFTRVIMDGKPTVAHTKDMRWRMKEKEINPIDIIRKIFEPKGDPDQKLLLYNEFADFSQYQKTI